MNVYSIDVKLVATAYIKAESENEARRLFNENYKRMYGGELPTTDGTLSDYSIEVSGAQFDSSDLPQVSLSPAVTFYGPSHRYGKIEFELVEEDVLTDEDEQEPAHG